MQHAAGAHGQAQQACVSHHHATAAGQPHRTQRSSLRRATAAPAATVGAALLEAGRGTDSNRSRSSSSSSSGGAADTRGSWGHDAALAPTTSGGRPLTRVRCDHSAPAPHEVPLFDVDLPWDVQQRAVELLRAGQQLWGPLLTQLISGSRSWRQVQALVVSQAAAMQPIHAAAALVRLARVQQAAAGRQQDSSGGSIWPPLPQAAPRQQQQQQQPRQLVTCGVVSGLPLAAAATAAAAAAAAAGAPAADAAGVHRLVERLLLPLLLRQLDAAPPRALANATWALAKLGHLPPAAAMTQLLQAVAAACPALEPQQLSSVLYALAVWQQQWQQQQQQQQQGSLAQAPSMSQQQQQQLWQPPPGVPAVLPHKLLDAAGTQLPRFGSQALANTLYAAALLQLRPSAAWQAAFWAASAAALPAAEAQHVSNTAWAAASLGLRPPAAWVAAWLQRSGALLARARDQQQLWQQGARHEQQQWAGRASPQAISNSLWAVAKLGMAPAALAHQVAAAPAAAAAGAGAGAGLAGRQGARGGGGGGGGGTSWPALLLHAAALQLPAFSGQGLANCCWALGSIARQLQQGGRHRRQQQALVAAMTAHSGWLPRLLQLLGPAQLSALQPRQLRDVLWGLATAGAPLPGPWLAAVVNAAVPKLPLLQPAEASSLLVALARCGHHPGASWLSLLERHSTRQLQQQHHQQRASGSSCLLVPSQVLVNSCWAFVQLRHAPSTQWLAAVASETALRLQRQPSAGDAGSSSSSSGGSGSGGSGTGDTVAEGFTPAGLALLLLLLSQLLVLRAAADADADAAPAPAAAGVLPPGLWQAVCDALLAPHAGGGDAGERVARSNSRLAGFTARSLAFLASSAALMPGGAADGAEGASSSSSSSSSSGSSSSSSSSAPAVTAAAALPAAAGATAAQAGSAAARERLVLATLQELAARVSARQPRAAAADDGAAAEHTSLQDIAQVVWAAGKLGLQPAGSHMQPLLGAALRRIEQLAAPGAAATAAAATPKQQQQQQQQRRRRRRQQPQQQQQRRRQPPATKSMGTLMHALGMLGYYPGSSWFAAFFAASRPLLRDCSRWTLSMLLYGCVWLEQVPPAPWSRAWWRAWQQQQQQQPQPQQPQQQQQQQQQQPQDGPLSAAAAATALDAACRAAVQGRRVLAAAAQPGAASAADEAALRELCGALLWRAARACRAPR